MFLVFSCSCLRSIHWRQVLSWEWRCSWSSADRRCSNYIWVINNFIAYKGATYIRGFTVRTKTTHSNLPTADCHDYSYDNTTGADKVERMTRFGLQCAYCKYSWMHNISLSLFVICVEQYTVCYLIAVVKEENRRIKTKQSNNKKPNKNMKSPIMRKV